ncbi:TlpA family protein disulfide reductase [Terriglobus aquaticus]|uniref:TlpA family protein disulfide reductase n=1 Tax=Terriglobus aquaticus TaxID=940139 RepID=A0ABW9KKV5_9BACT|nr:TlpA disulfide reductase family protein [Terriglobus aquaticus]
MLPSFRFVRRFAALVLPCALLVASGCNRGDHPQQVSQQAPDFVVRDGARTVRLQDYRGKTVVLNFWATWCAPCLDELPSLQQMQQQVPQVQVLAVSIDDDPVAYADFLKQYKLKLFSVRDGSEGANLRFGSIRVPETFVIDRNGVIRRKFVGPQDWTSPEIESFLTKL